MIWFKVVLGGLIAGLLTILPSLWRFKELLAAPTVRGFLIVFALASMADNYSQLRWGSEESSQDPWAKRANSAFLAVILASSLERSWVPALLPRQGWFPWAGVGLVLMGALLRLAAVSALGKSFTGSLAATSRNLVSGGVYTRLRHPSYLGAQILATGAALALSSTIGVILSAAILLPLILRRVQQEELFLAQAYGDSWREYTGKTQRLIPGLY